jgi:hypothetical protein
MAKINMVVQGKPVNGTVIASYARRVGSLDEIFSVWANAGARQLAEHGNNAWLVSLFDQQVLRMRNGDLSKLGKEVFQYVSAFYPALKWDKDNQKLARSKVAKDSILQTHFADPTATAADEAAGIVEFREKFYRPHGDFALTLTEWRNRETASKDVEDEALPTVAAKALAKQLDKALAAMDAKRFIGASDELKAAADKAKSVYLLLEALTAALVKDETPIDPVKADELLKSGQKGKSARAGGKVADEKVAA